MWRVKRKRRSRTTLLLALSLASVIAISTSRLLADDPVPPFKIALVSNREHYWYPHVYLYEHDGSSRGKITGSLQPQDKRLDHQPVLSADGRYCVYGYEVEGTVGKLQWWDFVDNKALDLVEINQGAQAVFSPSLSADGSLLAFSGWARAGSSARWDVFLFDLTAKQWIELPGLNMAKQDERRTAISGDGQWLAFTSNAPDGKGLTDVRMYDRTSQQVLALSDMNSPAADSYPSLSNDGRLLCFGSDREGGSGGLDIYLYDRRENRFVDLPGLNSPGHEQSPSITADGRLIAFVSERFDGAGEHDVFVYDRVTGQLVDTPDLNTDRDDFDPCIITTPRASAAQ